MMPLKSFSIVQRSFHIHVDAFKLKKGCEELMLRSLDFCDFILQLTAVDYMFIDSNR